MTEASGTITAFVEGHAPDRVFSRIERSKRAETRRTNTWPRTIASMALFKDAVELTDGGNALNLCKGSGLPSFG
jgi:hypothetical protein